MLTNSTKVMERRATQASGAAALLELCLSGHPNAHAQVFDRFAPTVERVLLHTLGPDGELEDLLHDVFLQVFRKITTIRDPEKVEGWVVRVTINTARMTLRKRKRGRWLSFFPAEEVPQQAVETTGSVSQAVHRVLKRMRNVDDRLAFVLRRLEGMSNEEVAKALGCSHSTAKRRVARGSQAFEQLARQEPLLCERLEER